MSSPFTDSSRAACPREASILPWSSGTAGPALPHLGAMLPLTALPKADLAKEIESKGEGRKLWPLHPVSFCSAALPAPPVWPYVTVSHLSLPGHPYWQCGLHNSICSIGSVTSPCLVGPRVKWGQWPCLICGIAMMCKWVCKALRSMSGLCKHRIRVCNHYYLQ